MLSRLVCRCATLLPLVASCAAASRVRVAEVRAEESTPALRVLVEVENPGDERLLVSQAEFELRVDGLLSAVGQLALATALEPRSTGEVELRIPLAATGAGAARWVERWIQLDCELLIEGHTGRTRVVARQRQLLRGLP